MTMQADPAELRGEKAQLLKADIDIQEGRRRLRNQENILRELEVDGHDTCQAELLLRLLNETLIEWKRHRTLIEARIAYLEMKVQRGMSLDCIGFAAESLQTLPGA